MYQLYFWLGAGSAVYFLLLAVFILWDHVRVCEAQPPDAPMSDPQNPQQEEQKRQDYLRRVVESFESTSHIQPVDPTELDPVKFQADVDRRDREFFEARYGRNLP